MKSILVLVMVAMNFAGIAQKITYTVSNDPKGSGLIYNGLVTFNNLDAEAAFDWLKDGREQYKPDQKAFDYLNTHLKEYSTVVFLGTWCDDSHELVPKLEKLLQMTGYPAGKLTMYGTDRAKKTKDGADKKYNITLVPTIILFSNGKEAGRITETVKKSIEADLMNIIERDQRSRPAH